MPTERMKARDYRIKQGLAVRKPQAVKKERQPRNKWEQEYHNLLSVMLRAKIIQAFYYEPEGYRFWLSDAPKTTYLPDFVVITNDGRVFVIEVKGYVRRDSKHIFIWASQKYPQYRFIMVTKKSGAWTRLFDLNTDKAELPKEIGNE